MEDTILQISVGSFIFKHSQSAGLLLSDGRAVEPQPRLKRLGRFLFQDESSGLSVLVEDFDPTSRRFTLRVGSRRVFVEVRDVLDEVSLRSGAVRTGIRKAVTIRSPMPGLIMQIMVQPGQSVRRGDGLLVLEAMKMENMLRAPSDGIVDTVLCQAGQSVEKGQELLRFRD
ncbi:MAG: acetyl-CoA carboxylase biotin carboxyl carrier protein subunit [Flavobacteriales bacterium]|nr:acetyl-CoA carboxylase biotin carboxyl carrier protein subunit [Flavobacteriales bacterium]MDW8409438.1 acetyl-CoA carboxylase biotin carboxyl carrier protein subunit [Flavobacteriales bacterium]